MVLILSHSGLPAREQEVTVLHQSVKQHLEPLMLLNAPLRLSGRTHCKTVAFTVLDPHDPLTYAE